MWEANVKIWVNIEDIQNAEKSFLRILIFKKKNINSWDFPGNPVVKTQRYQCRECGFDPWTRN